MKFIILLLLGAAAMQVPSSSAETKPLRVLCWNLHHGVGEDGKLDLERIANVILKAKPDLVALQEIDKHCARSGNVDQTAELARLTHMTGIFGKAMNLGSGGYGQTILSRHPILHSKVHPLPGKGEPRIAFEASISINGTEMRLISLHLDLDAAQRLAQSETLANTLKTSPSPIILCGDFNDTPGSPPLATIARELMAVPKKLPVFTCPAATPTEEIDHFFAKGFTPTGPLEVLPEAVASDHRPLLAEFLRK